MDIIKELKEVPDYTEKGWGELLATYNPLIAPQMKVSAYLDNNIGWVYACASVIADEIAKIELKLYRYSGAGEEEDVKQVDAHPALDTLFKANNFTTKFDLFWLIAQYLKLTGEAPLYIVKQNGIPVQLYLLRPDRLTVKAGVGDEFVGGYKYRNDAGRDIEIAKEELIFIKQPDPRNPFRGLSTLQAAARVVDIENYSEEYNRNYFYNGASAGMLFKTDQKLDRSQKTELRAQIDQQYKGVRNAHKYMILESGLSAEPIQMSARDMEFFNQLNWTRDKILGIFRVPRTALGITDDVNRANAEATDYVFAKRTIKPLMQMIIEQLNEFYIPMFKDGANLWLDFEDPVPEDVTSKVTYFAQGLQNGWLTINEVRKEEGLPAIEGGDRIFARDALMGQVQAPIDQTPSEAKRLLDIKRKIFARSKRSTAELIKSEIKETIKSSVGAVKAEIKSLVIKDEIRQDNEIMQWSESRKDSNWGNIIKRADRNEMRIRSAVAKQFRAQSSKVTSGKKAVAKKDKWLLDIEKEQEIWVKVLLPIINDIVREEGQSVIDDLLSGKVFNNRDDVIRDFIYNHTSKIAKDINKNTNESILRILNDNKDENETVIAKKIGLMFDDMEVSRAKTIARTETFKAVNFATDEAYKQSDVVRAKEWYTGLDERVCEFCGPLHGKRFKVGEDIFSKGRRLAGADGGTLDLDYETIQTPPLHANCRCGLVPVLVGAKEYSAIVAKQNKNEVSKKLDDMAEKIEENSKNFEKVHENIENIKAATDQKLEEISNNIDDALKNE